MIIIYSGGLDSTVLLHEYQKDIKMAISFDYGSKHNQKEIKYAKKNTKKLGIEHKIIKLPFINELFKSDLLKNGGEIPDGHYEEENMKSTVVPFRNGIMLSIAAGIADSIGAKKILIANHAGDHCIRADQNVLTVNGLKKISELVQGQKIYSYNTETKKTEIDTVNKIWKKGRPSNILEVIFKNGEKLYATDQHEVYKCYLSEYNKNFGFVKTIKKTKLNEFDVKDICMLPHIEQPYNEELNLDIKDFISNLIPSHFFEIFDLIDDDESYYLKSKTQNRNLTSISKKCGVEDLIEILCWYLTEGYTKKKSNSAASNFNSVISQTSSHNMNYSIQIENLIKKITNNISLDNKKIFNGQIREINFNINGTLSAFVQSCGRTSKEKHIPEYLFNLLQINKDIRNIFLSTMLKGDGHFSKYNINQTQYTSFSPILLKQMIVLFMIDGNKVNLSNKNSITMTTINRSINQSLFENLFMNNIKEINIVENNQEVYDISVEKNHNFFCGENGMILVSNSIYPDCRESFIGEMNSAIAYGTENHVNILAPYTSITKREIALIGQKLGVDFKNTWSCYKGNDLQCGTCVSGDTDILMSDYTYKKIKDIEIGDEILGYDFENKKILPNKVLNFFNNGYKNTKKYYIDEKTYLECTPDHHVARQNESKHVKFNKIENIFKKLKHNKIFYFNNQKNIISNEDNFWLGWLCGIWDGDGTISIPKNWPNQKCMSIVCNIPEMVKLIQEKLDYFGFSNRLGNHTSKNILLSENVFNIPIINIRKTYDANKLIDMFDWEKNKTNKDFICGWLRGMIDTDGNVNKNSYRISQSKLDKVEKIIYSLQFLNINYTRQISKKENHKGVLKCNFDQNTFCLNNKTLINNILGMKTIKFGTDNILLKHFNKTQFINSVEMEEPQEVFDITTEFGNYIANGILVHNCGTCVERKEALEGFDPTVYETK